MPSYADNEVSVYVELWIAQRLRRPDLYAGVTSVDERRERVRAVILEQGLADVAVKGQTTWRQAFERAFRQPLESINGVAS